MGIENLVSRLAGSSSWKTDVSGSGHDSLSLSDIAYCLHGLPPECLAYCHAKYFAISRSVPDLVEWAYQQENPGKKHLELSVLALTESLFPRKCPDCSGRGEIWLKHGRIIECQRCHGSGNAPYSKAERARQIGVSRECFRHYQPRYERIYRRVNALDGQIKGHVKRKLGKNVD